MNILVVGGAGYIGGSLCDQLIASGYDISIYDSLVYENRFLKKVPFIYGDIRDRAKLESILGDYDAVVWLAAIVGDGACAIDPFLSQTLNSDTVRWLSENYGGKIIFTSSCSVYGKNDNLIDESATPNPLSIYAATKLEAERHLQRNATNALIFRLGTLYGLGDSHSRVRFDLVVNVLTQKATIGESLTVFGGDQWRPLLHVKDVASAMIHGLKYDITGLYNLHNENYKIYQIADVISSVVPNTKVAYQEMSFEDSRNYKITSDAFRKLGWMPQISMTQGIEEIHRVIKERRIKDVRDVVYSNVDYLKTMPSDDWIKR